MQMHGMLHTPGLRNVPRVERLQAAARTANTCPESVELPNYLRLPRPPAPSKRPATILISSYGIHHQRFHDDRRYHHVPKAADA